LPTLLTSPPSCGKSLFLSHLAHVLFPGSKNQIVTIQLSDTSLEPRSLLGSYVSSTRQPGVFEWKEGALIRAMREGKWIVFRDIDRGSNEVLGIIKPLAESLGPDKWIGGQASLNLPGHGRVRAHENFALFATRTLPTAPKGKSEFTPPSFFGAHKFYETFVPSPGQEELRNILDSRFPNLAGSPVRAFIDLWECVKALGPAASIGLRDLEKFLTRIQGILPPHHSIGVDVDEKALLPPIVYIPQPGTARGRVP
jgi:midasin